MAERRRRRFKRTDRKPDKKSTKKTVMLSTKKILEMKYDLREAMDSAGLEETEVNNIIANIVAKGTRSSMKDAKEYVQSLGEEGIIPEGTVKALLAVLDRYRKFR